MGQAEGLCKCCFNDVGERRSEKAGGLPPKKVLRPLLSDLESDFKEFCGKDGRLDQDQLCAVWKKGAQRKLGNLSKTDVDLIDTSTRLAFDQIDLDHSGKIAWHEFMIYMLGATQEQGPLKSMRHDLNEYLAQDPKLIEALVNQFTQWDKNGDGYITPQELEQQLHDLEKMMAANGEGSDIKRDYAQLLKMKDVIFEEADVMHDGRIALWEFMAHALGRRQQPVELLLYDVSKGAADKLGKLMAGKRVQAVHSGVLVYGSEFWYAGRIVVSKPPCTKVFGPPLASPWDEPLPLSEYNPDLPVVRVGYTFVTKDEFKHFMKQNLNERYTGIEKYDLLTHSCNHYANEVVQFLTGRPLPEKVFELQKMALTPFIQAMRPVLNKFIGGFGEAGLEVDEDYFTKESEHPDLTRTQSDINDGIGIHTGDIVAVEGIAPSPVIGTIFNQKDDSYDVKYFDPETSTTMTAQGVSKHQIHEC